MSCIVLLAYNDVSLWYYFLYFIDEFFLIVLWSVLFYMWSTQHQRSWVLTNVRILSILVAFVFVNKFLVMLMNVFSLFCLSWLIENLSDRCWYSFKKDMIFMVYFMWTLLEVFVVYSWWSFNRKEYFALNPFWCWTLDLSWWLLVMYRQLASLGKCSNGYVWICFMWALTL